MKFTKDKKEKYVLNIFKLCYTLLTVSALYVLRLQFFSEGKESEFLRASFTYNMCTYVVLSLIILTGAFFLFLKNEFCAK